MSIGPHAAWAPAVQEIGRCEMQRRLDERGPAAAADYASRFEASANEWLEHSGFAPRFRFDRIELPPVS